MASCTVEKHAEENVVQQLNELFGNVLNLELIKKVAVSCDYDVTESSNKLLEISSLSDTNIIRREPIRNTNTVINSQVTLKKYPLIPINVSSDIPIKSKKALDIERAINYIQQGYKVLIIMRGLPGSGKSFLSKYILESTIGFDSKYKHILSADDFFIKNGSYQYDSNKLSDAHGWNHQRAFQEMSRGVSPIIIDNTNTRMWEMKPYAMMATDYGYIVEILEPDNHWCFNVKELAKRNTHGVPKAKIEDMLDRYEKNITPRKLLSAYNLVYRLQKPPQLRLYPPLNKNNSGSTYALAPNSNLQESRALDKKTYVSNSCSALNLHTIQTKSSQPIETINLMDFNDEMNSVKSDSSINLNKSASFDMCSDQNPIDRILMYSNDSTNINLSVLQPSQQNKTDVIIIDSSDEEEDMIQKERRLFSDIERAWGVNENALRSWDIVTPIKDEGYLTKIPSQVHKEYKIVSVDSSCNTEDDYFQILRKGIFNGNNFDFKILDTVNRDINRSTPKREPVLMKKPVHDKSCLTDDIFEDYDNHISQLINLFPGLPHNHLKYWYHKCKGDLEWTIEFLLESKEEEITMLMEDSEIINEEYSNASTNESSNDSSDNSPTEILNFNDNKIKRNRKVVDEYIDLKKIIESRVDINDEHYSKHLLKIKHLKFGSTNDVFDDSKMQVDINDTQISTTVPELEINNCKPSTSKGESYITDVGKIIIVDSDIEFDECDIEDNIDKAEQKAEETIELNLGEHFVTQLEEKFGDPNISYPKGFQPVVQVPVGLARQLYTFYIESVYQQMETQKLVMETLTKEDEEFARKLQAKEEKKANLGPKPTPNLQQIMDEQTAQNIYQKEAEKWKDLNPDNLSARMTRQKLFDVFPKINKDTLTEILYAHGNKYQDTLETLLASTSPEDVRGSIDVIKEPPIRDDVLEEMKEAQKTSGNEEYDDQKKATFYRDEAGKYLKKRADLYQKAQKYHQCGMTEVAQFYSGLASQQTVYYDRANNLAATAFLDEHSKRLQDFNTIDLHFLYVKEAIPALDVFLDRNINLVKLSTNKQSEYLQIITGRGKRSENGISKIKPAVMSRLKKRKINFVQLNPGLLKVKITKNSVVTSEIVNE